MINAAGAHCVRSDAQKYDNPQIMYRGTGRTTKLSQHCHTIVIRIPVRSRNLRDCSCPARDRLRYYPGKSLIHAHHTPAIPSGKHSTACTRSTARRPGTSARPALCRTVPVPSRTTASGRARHNTGTASQHRRKTCGPHRTQQRTGIAASRPNFYDTLFW